MNIVMLNTQGLGVGSYRHWMPAEALKRRGHTVFYTPGINCSLDNESLFTVLARYVDDADVIHTGFATHPTYTGALATARNYILQTAKRNLPVIIDVDDDLLHVPSYNIGFRDYAVDGFERRAALWCIRNGDALTVTTPHLARLYEDFNYNISTLPNCIHPPEWENLPTDPARKSSEDVRILFAGGVGRKADLDHIQEALELVMAARPQVRLFFMAMMPDWAMQWCPSASDPRANRAFYIDSSDNVLYKRIVSWLGIDIALAPVVENDFNRGKSDIKVLESPFYGAAAVCSDFETYASVPAECVLKAQTTYEWKESLLALVDDPVLRAKKKARCLEWACDTRTIDQNIERWEHTYEEALARPVIGPEGENMKTGLIAPPPRPGLIIPS